MGRNWQLVSIGSCNGLAVNRRQAIAWSNDDPVYRRIYAAIRRDEVTQFMWDGLKQWRYINDAIVALLLPDSADAKRSQDGN